MKSLDTRIMALQEQVGQMHALIELPVRLCPGLEGPKEAPSIPWAPGTTLEQAIAENENAIFISYMLSHPVANRNIEDFV